MMLSLRANSKVYINGAVIRVDRKVNMELMNDVVFLLENHVMQVDDANTPLKQLYFVIQSVLIDPGSRANMQPVIFSMLRALKVSSASDANADGLQEAIAEIEADKHFLALKRLRGIINEDKQAETDLGETVETLKRRLA